MHPHSAHLPGPPYPSLIPALPPQRRQIKVSKQKQKQTKNPKPKQNPQQQKHIFASPSFLPLQHLFTHPGGMAQTLKARLMAKNM